MAFLVYSMLFFILLFFLALVCIIYKIFVLIFLYKDCELRQENSALWLVLGLFFDIIVFIIYFFSFRKKEYPLTNQNEISTNKYFKQIKYYLIFALVINIVIFSFGLLGLLI